MAGNCHNHKINPDYFWCEHGSSDGSWDRRLISLIQGKAYMLGNIGIFYKINIIMTVVVDFDLILPNPPAMVVLMKGDYLFILDEVNKYLSGAQ